MAENEKSSEEKVQNAVKESAEARQPATKGASEEKKKDSPAPEQAAAKPEQQKKKDKKGKQPAREEEPAKKKEHDENFNYILRVVNTDINGENNISAASGSIDPSTNMYWFLRVLSCKYFFYPCPLYFRHNNKLAKGDMFVAFMNYGDETNVSTGNVQQY